MNTVLRGRNGGMDLISRSVKLRFMVMARRRLIRVLGHRLDALWLLYSRLRSCKNRNCHISSFLVSQKDMWESAMRVTSTKESDWIVKYEDVQERNNSAVERFQKGDWSGFGQMMYARSFFPDGGRRL
jgi:hypothetical protein